MKNRFGWSLIEILVTLSIIGILGAISGNYYLHYIVKERRLEAEVSLSKLALVMEDYFSNHHTFRGATLAHLGFTETVAQKRYSLQIASADDTGFLLSAIPIGDQFLKDSQCGTLSLNSVNIKNISGRGPIHECW